MVAGLKMSRLGFSHRCCLRVLFLLALLRVRVGVLVLARVGELDRVEGWALVLEWAQDLGLAQVLEWVLALELALALGLALAPVWAMVPEWAQARELALAQALALVRVSAPVEELALVQLALNLLYLINDQAFPPPSAA